MAFVSRNLPRGSGVKPKPHPKPDVPGSEPGKPAENPAASRKNCRRGKNFARAFDEDCEETDSSLSEDPGWKPEDSYKSGAKAMGIFEAKINDLRNSPGALGDAPITRPLAPAYRLGLTPPEKLVLKDIFENVDRMFTDLGLNSERSLQKTQVHALDGNGQATKEGLVAENYFSKDGRDDIIIAESNQMRSKNIAPEAQKIEHWSELFYQVVRGVYPNEAPDIKYILRDAVNNEATKDRLIEAHRDFPQLVSNEKGTFNPASSDPREVQKCMELIGSPNGVGIPFLLGDYPATFRQKKIEKIHTWVLVKDQKWAMGFELTPF